MLKSYSDPRTTPPEQFPVWAAPVAHTRPRPVITATYFSLQSSKWTHSAPLNDSLFLGLRQWEGFYLSGAAEGNVHGMRRSPTDVGEPYHGDRAFAAMGLQNDVRGK